ncbi:MAG: PilZ domain-containing protein [Kofleriaceae bacterium]
MSEQQPQPRFGTADRRRHYRIPRAVQAVLHVGVTTMPGRVQDLSLGGLRMRVGDGAACPAVGSVGLLEVQLASGWYRLRVKVVRCAFDEVAVRFQQITPQLEDAIEDEVVAGIEAARRPHILVVDPSPVRRQRIAETLRTAGCESVEAATPLEAIGIVERRCGAIRGMTIAESLTQTRADEFCEYVSQSNPEIQLRIIADGTRDIPIESAADDAEPSVAPSPPEIHVVPDDDTLDLALRDFAADAARTLKLLERS